MEIAYLIKHKEAYMYKDFPLGKELSLALLFPTFTFIQCTDLKRNKRARSSHPFPYSG